MVKIAKTLVSGISAAGISAAAIISIAMLAVTSCKSTGAQLASDGVARGTESAVSLPSECREVDRLAKKVEGLILDYSKAEAPLNQEDSDALEIKDQDQLESIEGYQVQLEELRQLFNICSQRAASINEECSFAGAARAGNDEPCQCYRSLTDSFEDGVGAKAAAKESGSCSEYFSKNNLPEKAPGPLESIQGGDRAPPKLSKSVDKEFTGCLCGSSGTECVMWRPGEKVAESWIGGPCNAGTCQLLSQSAPACALVYRLVETN